MATLLEVFGPSLTEHKEHIHIHNNTKRESKETNKNYK